MMAGTSCYWSASTIRRWRVWKSATAKRAPLRSSVDRARSFKIRFAMAAGRGWLCPGRLRFKAGIPITFEGKVIGAIGVSGNTPQEDEDIAKVGAESASAAIRSE